MSTVVSIQDRSIDDKKQYVMYRNLVNMQIKGGGLINTRLLKCSDIITLNLNIPGIDSYPCLLTSLIGSGVKTGSRYGSLWTSSSIS